MEPYSVKFYLPEPTLKFLYEKKDWVPWWLWKLVSSPSLSHNVQVSLLRAKKAFEQELEKGINGSGK